MSEFFNTSDKERKALYGLLPEIQLLYMLGIRVYMDKMTGIVGIDKKVSLHALREVLYVLPHPGIAKSRSGIPTESKVRRGIKTLIKSGLLKQIRHKNKLVFKCLLASHLDTPNRVKQTHKKRLKKPINKRYFERVTVLTRRQAIAYTDTKHSRERS